jgi:hypothetical protein
MSLELLKSFRMKGSSKPTVKQMIIQVCASFVFGVILGLISKFSDNVSSNSWYGLFFSGISDITTNLGVWVVLATLIAVWSRSPIYASINVFIFFIGMLLAYYTYSQVLFGFFPTYYFLRWGAIALASPVAAYIVWFSKGEGWRAAFCAALPIGLLLVKGYPFFYVLMLGFGIDLLLAMLLLVILAKTKAQFLKVFTLSILVAFIHRKFDILPYLFGGL